MDSDSSGILNTSIALSDVSQGELFYRIHCAYYNVVTGDSLTPWSALSFTEKIAWEDRAHENRED